MNCPRCGNPIEGKVHFCPHCGADLPEVESTRPCPHCGAQIDRRATFCPQCGEQTSGRKQMSQSDRLAELRARVEAEMRMPPVQIRRGGAKRRKRPADAARTPPEAGPSPTRDTTKPRAQAAAPTAPPPPKERERRQEAPPRPEPRVTPQPPRQAERPAPTTAKPERAQTPPPRQAEPVTPPPPRPEPERPRYEAPQRAEPRVAPEAPQPVEKEAPPAPQPERMPPRHEAPQHTGPVVTPPPEAPRRAEPTPAPEARQEAAPEAPPQAAPEEVQRPPADRVIRRPPDVRPRTQTVFVDGVARPTADEVKAEPEPEAPEPEPVAFEAEAPGPEPVEFEAEADQWMAAEPAEAEVEQAPFEQAAPQPAFEPAPVELELEPEVGVVQPEPWVEATPPVRRRSGSRFTRMVTIVGLLAGVTLATTVLVGADRVGLSIPGLPLFGSHTPTQAPAETPVVVVQPEDTATPSTVLTATVPTMPTEAPTATPEPSTAPATNGDGTVTHVVQPGESLSQIASDYGVSAADIIRANSLDTETIYPSQQLIIPGQAQPAANATPTVHVVQSGENLVMIAQQYGVSTTAIMAANNITDPNTISVGQELTIPGTGTTATAAPTAMPTATALPTMTPTPALTPTAPAAAAAESATPVAEGTANAFAAPSLLTPTNGATVQGAEDVVLNWTSVGLLADDTWYVVKIWRDDPSLPTPPAGWTRTTAWRIPASFRPTDGSSTTFHWSVTVMRAVEGQTPEALSPTSEERTFNWQ